MSWSDLLGDPWLDVELAKLGITTSDLVWDIQEVPELRERCEGLNSLGLLALALEWFGDQRQPQPTERTADFAGRRTPDWGQLPPLPDEQESASASERQGRGGNERRTTFGQREFQKAQVLLGDRKGIRGTAKGAA